MMNENFSIKHIFGLKVRDLRLERGFSFQELAAESGLSVSYLSEIEKGKKYPKGDKIMQLAQALGVSYDNLVSLQVSKKLQPVIKLLQSEFFKEFPLELFGLDAQKIIELISVSPEKINAFINSIQVLSRNYEMGQEHFYYSALRSYQEMHDNYFADLEKAASEFRQQHKVEEIAPGIEVLERILKEDFNVNIDREELAQYEALKHLRSFYKSSEKQLLINVGLNEAQERFLIARELGFQFLKLRIRPNETPPQKEYQFEGILNNYKASYFSAALLMPEKEVVNDTKDFAAQTDWNEKKLLSYLDKYKATPEMIMQRLTNLLPIYSGIKDLFFLRFLGTDDFSTYELTKELHLSRNHNPHGNSLNEHYCRRWISISLIKELRSVQRLKHSNDYLAGIQISQYHNTSDEYLCLTIAFPNVSNPNESMSVTIGCYIDEALRSRIKFLDDKKIKSRIVNTTCERCALTNCNDRIAPPYHIEAMEKQELVTKAISELNGE
ncbi:XRE family transcriptional regulator [Fulvivirga sp. RKSG066]|uniref:helix-turn-helix domain-containing protein n=1 Tax=Fulvivirga aurantia TaxID=2529383 RepID=UPI0012BB8868|nr:XRE family transcriptional regulator [Fulvivirga aurantia]MTI21556.1 XRE family transcriptional regulator [Fulvivirga aurantia]